MKLLINSVYMIRHPSRQLDLHQTIHLKAYTLHPVEECWDGVREFFPFLTLRWILILYLLSDLLMTRVLLVLL